MHSTRSHLYDGFVLADRLPSISFQRGIQRKLLDTIPVTSPARVLSIGCGFGGELDQVFEPYFTKQHCESFVAVDISSLSGRCLHGRLAQALGKRFHWYEMDFLEFLASECGHNNKPFDLIQCGFFLHDIEWSEKDNALHAIRRACRSDGWLLLSDIFVCEDHQFHWREYSKEVEALYDRFVSEAVQMHDAGVLSKEEYRDFVGDEAGSGLKQTQRDAVAGQRDFFESIETTISRLKRVGFRVGSITTNSLHQNLSVIIAQVEG
jgi:ubiquinone/menaquinone biosynthesis C-methylase UbiE